MSDRIYYFLSTSEFWGIDCQEAPMVGIDVKRVQCVLILGTAYPTVCEEK